jgi:hemoglobin
MRTLMRTLVLVGIAGFSTAAHAQMTAKPDSLYKRLGGYDAIAAVTDSFVPRLVKDPMLAKYFVHSEDTLKHIRQMAVDLLCFATGGPCIYVGRDMKTAHKGLGISAAEWETAVKHLAATLDQFKVPSKEKEEFLALTGTLRGDIVEK